MLPLASVIVVASVAVELAAPEVVAVEAAESVVLDASLDDVGD